MVLDICHTLNQFCAPLPADYEDFKEMANTIFPNILDTKVRYYFLMYLFACTLHDIACLTD